MAAGFQDLRARFEAVPALSPQLSYFLDLVWSHRNWTVPQWTQQNLQARGQAVPAAPGHAPQMALEAIYNLYNRAFQHPDEEAKRLTARTLEFLERLRGLPGQLVLQSPGNPNDWDHTIGEWIDMARNDEGVLNRLSQAFFHFRNPARANIPCLERIYVNVKPEYAAEVMNFVVPQLVMSPMLAGPADHVVNEALGVIEAKVAAPGLTRRDRIVIYLTTAGEVDKTLVWIARYQNGYLVPRASPAWFNSGPPSMTRQVRIAGHMCLTGIGVGAEPPQQGQSFGTVRAGLIQEALGYTFNHARTKEQFIGEVVGRFRAVGIDPANPSLQIR